MFPVENPTEGDLQLLVVVLYVEVESDVINPELESCNQKITVLSQTWQQAPILESLSPCPQLRSVCQIKGIAFPHIPWLTCLLTLPKSGTSPSELDGISK